MDGIQTPVDTDLDNRGAPNSPLSSYLTSGRFALTTEVKVDDVKVYPNPVKVGEAINVRLGSDRDATYILVDATGKNVATGNFKNTVSMKQVDYYLDCIC